MSLRYATTAGKPDEPAITLLIMHGYGADEFDLLPIAKQFEGNFNAISIQAPIELDWGGFAWYHLSQTITGIHGDDASRIESEEKVVDFLRSQKEEGKLNEVILMGFSQGAAMSYSLLANEAFHGLGLNLKAVIALSGYIPLDIRPKLSDRQLGGLPVFMSHGLYDDLIPPQALDSAKELLEKQGATVTAKTYEVGHGLTEETIADINQFLVASL
ncbi:MAG TPA: dienelactone hydrolase family protein [Candidatus Kapabacteria bacterium]